MNTVEKSPAKKIAYFDILNVLATLSVVWIHFGNEVHWYDGSSAWKMCVPIQVLAYWAVPVFFMFTGATLMNYREKYDTKTFFRRRLYRGILPYLLWGTILLIVRWDNLSQGVTGWSGKINLIVNSYVNNSMESIYWFFIPLIAIYFAMPVLSLLARKDNRDILNYALIVGAISISVLPFGYNFIQTLLFTNSGFAWNGMWNFPAFGGYALYPVLGYWAATQDFSKKQRLTIYIVGVGCAAFRFWGIWYLSARDGVVPQVFMDYLSFPAVGLALAVWVYIRYAKWSNPVGNVRLCSFLSVLSRCGLGVYLIHIFVINWMAPLECFGKYSAKWYYGWPILVYAACVLFVWVIKKIPVLKWLFP